MVQGPGQFAHALRGLLDAQLDAAARLTELLQAERGALESGQADALDGITARKPQVLGELEQLVSRQSTLLATAGFDRSSAGLQQAFGWCDASGSLKALQERLATQLSECSEQNQANGILVQMRIGFVRRALHSIRGPEFAEQTYGRDGRAPLETGRRLLGSG